jgi:hypothetical protein
LLSGSEAWGSDRAVTASYALAAEWHLDTAARLTGPRQATTPDSSGNSVDLVVTNPTPSLVPGRFGSAFDLSQYAATRASQNGDLQVGTVAVVAWVKRSGSPGQYRYLVGFGAHVSQTYAGWSDYNFTTALAAALATAATRDEFAEADALFWRRFNERQGAPTQKELARHIKLYGHQGTEPFVGTETEGADVLTLKSAEANLKEAGRERSRRRVGVKEQVKALRDRSPDLTPAAIADTLNLSDRRVKQILSELAA